MANKQLQEINAKSADELRKAVSDSRLRLRAMKFDLIAGKVKNVTEIKKLRITIARMLTVINQK